MTTASFGGLKTQTFEIEFQSASFFKQYHYRLCVNYKMEICENVMCMFCARSIGMRTDA